MAAGFTIGLLVKGVFVVLPIVAMALWIAINPRRSHGRASVPCSRSSPGWGHGGGRASTTRTTLLSPVRLLGSVLAATARTAVDPHAARGRVHTGAARAVLHQPRHLASGAVERRACRHPLAIPLPVTPRFLARADTRERGAAFAVVFAVLAILALSPANRLAERYAFAATFAVACAGVVAAMREWPAVSARLRALDQRIPALPATLWIVSILLRLASSHWRALDAPVRVVLKEL